MNAQLPSIRGRSGPTFSRSVGQRLRLVPLRRRRCHDDETINKRSVRSRPARLASVIDADGPGWMRADGSGGIGGVRIIEFSVRVRPWIPAEIRVLSRTLISGSDPQPVRVRKVCRQVSKQHVYSSSQGCHTATGTHMPHGITQCYLPPGRDDIPALTPAEAGTRLSDPGGMQACKAELT